MDHSKLTEKIIGAAFDVSNDLGCGFLEKVYENALIIRFAELGLKAESQKIIEVYYHNKKVGHYLGDIIVEELVIIEIKAVQEISPVHKAQIINYLRAAGMSVGILINFGNPKLQYRRFQNRNLSPSTP